ncbi:PepSY domain-containing protein [Streptomyces sp. CNQ085]|uniref:PepSY domain-containing protein n=1 Tax=Streptomyces sp. CNQ085 TaxID=2886944 RepID=UPI001F50D12B|nr:PepSY domain-containing protein [Streptomyces sp. CNQ085]MCI0384933.1 PepSY domain-containing protein [Streptomyces sp. CNQ085]
MNRKLLVAAVATAALAVAGSTLAFADDDTAQDALAASLRVGAGTGDRDDDRGGDDRDDDRDDDRGGDDRDDDRRAPRGTGVTLQEAVTAALRAVPGTAESAELDDDDGRPAWEVDVLGEDGTWHEVSVDANSADVLKRGAGADDRDDDRDSDDDADDRREG